MQGVCRVYAGPCPVARYLVQVQYASVYAEQKGFERFSRAPIEFLGSHFCNYFCTLKTRTHMPRTAYTPAKEPVEQLVIPAPDNNDQTPYWAPVPAIYAAAQHAMAAIWAGIHIQNWVHH